MDALEMLESEHRDIEALLAKLDQAKGTQARHLIQQLKDQVDLIEQLEEQHLFTPLRHDEDAKDMVLEGFTAHELVNRLLSELSEMKPNDELWRPKVHLLRENLEHHIREEETQLFPRVRMIWDDDKRRHLYRKMEQLKARIKKARELGLLPA